PSGGPLRSEQSQGRPAGPPDTEAPAWLGGPVGESPVGVRPPIPGRPPAPSATPQAATPADAAPAASPVRPPSGSSVSPAPGASTAEAPSGDRVLGSERPGEFGVSPGWTAAQVAPEFSGRTAPRGS